MRSSNFPLIIVLLALEAHLCLARSLYVQPSLQRQDQSPLGAWDTDNARFRQAEEKDVSDITNVIYDAFGATEGTKYIHLPGNSYKKEEWKCMRKQVKTALRGKSNTTFLNVIAVPMKSGRHGDSEAFASDDDPSQEDVHERVVAIAAWALLEPNNDDDNSSALANLALTNCGLQHASIHSQQEAPSNSIHTTSCNDNPGINMTRALDLSAQLEPAIQKHIASVRTQQLYLALLATHPDWDGHGFGARHVSWGLWHAALWGVPSTLIATPAGFPLYESLGFEAVANITVEMLDGLGMLWWEYMRYDIDDDNRLRKS